MDKAEHDLIQLFTQKYGVPPQHVYKLPGSGSYRSYYRLLGEHESVIGAHNADILENNAFISFTNHFSLSGLPVPEILASEQENRVYLVTDLGDVTLYQFLCEKRSDLAAEEFPSEVIGMYKKALTWLPKFQVSAAKSIDYSVCYPRAAFDRQSMMWDLNYFKYYFLKLAKIPFDEQTLEDDFTRLCDLLLSAEPDFFLFRDFQSRNIMIVNNEPWFIDYQGGRKGALQYDIASLLTDGKADLPELVRQDLLEFYLDRLSEIFPVNRQRFMETYFGFVLIRILQALGAYGFRGYYEKKSHFLQSIPFALRNLRYLRGQNLIGFGLHALMEVIDHMVLDPALVNREFSDKKTENRSPAFAITPIQQEPAIKKKLTVTITSFSYKKTMPADTSGNGGGFVFDCRALPNPGRYEEYKQLTGKDQAVISFLAKEPEVAHFLEHVYALAGQSVKTYAERGFEHLMVSFGCTGGQHRSVYCAENLAIYLSNNFDITIALHHTEQPWTSHLKLNT